MKDALHSLAFAYLADRAAPGTIFNDVQIDGANAAIHWTQKDVEIFGMGRRDNHGVLTVPLATLVRLPASTIGAV